MPPGAMVNGERPDEREAPDRHTADARAGERKTRRDAGNGRNAATALLRNFCPSAKIIYVATLTMLIDNVLAHEKRP